MDCSKKSTLLVLLCTVYDFRIINAANNPWITLVKPNKTYIVPKELQKLVRTTKILRKEIKERLQTILGYILKIQKKSLTYKENQLDNNKKTQRFSKKKYHDKDYKN